MFSTSGFLQETKNPNVILLMVSVYQHKAEVLSYCFVFRKDNHVNRLCISTLSEFRKQLNVTVCVYTVTLSVTMSYTGDMSVSQSCLMDLLRGDFMTLKRVQM